VRSAVTVFTLFALWLLLSGVYKPLVIGLGFVSAVISVWVVRRMDNEADADRLEVHLKPIALIKYLGWLMVEIAKANWAVTKIILSRDMDMNSKLFKVPHSQKTDLGQAIFANSITLTPGTVSVEVEPNEMVLVLIRLYAGPTVYDRVLAVNSFGTYAVLFIGVLGFLTGRPDFLDIALVYALINFIGTIAVLKFFRYKTLGDTFTPNQDEA